MISGFEWLLLATFSTALVALAMLAALWLAVQRRANARVLSSMGALLDMRYKVLGRDHLSRPEAFVLHARPGVSSEHSVIQRCLVSRRSQGLPAVFEYVSYRDPMGVRRLGSPSLVLAVRVPPEVPAFRLRPRLPLEKFWRSAHSASEVHAGVPPGWVFHLDASTHPGGDSPALDLERLTGSALWLQVHGHTLYIVLPRSLWPCAQFTPCGIERIVRTALPVLQALGSPDISNLESLLRPGDPAAQVSEG